jgi:hybrid polyketide synthase/nonribosomal peptide synthetase ACE1
MHFAVGSRLLNSSPIVSDCIKRLQESLDNLPVHHVPAWSLRSELMRDSITTRLGEAGISQPLCTAIQIAIVDLLKSVGLTFIAVVGHSSGEIATAYAAGYISAQDAIRIAYYRGYILENSMDASTPPGAMLAAGTTLDDAEELCRLPLLRDKICIAARNSATSMTLSGDRDTVTIAKEVLEDEHKFARLLKVDRAYHSHHMLSCVKPYMDALQALNIQVHQPQEGNPVWVSSVTGNIMTGLALGDLRDQYWGQNLSQPVLFSDAVENAISSCGVPSMVIEIGPHPALKGPVLDTIQHLSGKAVPYVGTLKRGSNDARALADCLGTLWTRLGPGVVDFTAVDNTFYNSPEPPKLLKNVPAYSWNHEHAFSYQTRQSKAFLTSGSRKHELIGTLDSAGTEKQLRYRSFIGARQVPWLEQHQVQGQIVFPAAAYISALIEAVALQYGTENIQVVEITDILISHALVVPQNSDVEVVLLMSRTDEETESTAFTFTFYSDTMGGDAHSMSQNASGKIQVVHGPPDENALPPPCQPEGQFISLNADLFYSSCSELGFDYVGDFRGLSDTARKADEAVGLLAVPIQREDQISQLIIHPATLDSGIQSLVIAYCYPRDGRLRSLQLPTRVDNIRVDVAACRYATSLPGAKLPFYSRITPSESIHFVGDVSIYSPGKTKTLIQMQGLQITALTPPTPEDDVNMFTEPVWGLDGPVGSNLDQEHVQSSSQYETASRLELLAYHYLQFLAKAVPRQERENLEWHHARFLDYVDHCIKSVESGSHPWVEASCLDSLEERAMGICKEHPNSIDVRLIQAIGESILPMVRGQLDILTVMTRENMLDEFFAQSVGMPSYLKEMARMVQELSHRYPHMNMIEIGEIIQEADMPGS